MTITDYDEVADAIREAQKNPGTVVLNFLTDTEEDVYPMIPGGKTVHDLVMDGSGKTVPVGGHGSAEVNGALETATASDYGGEWTDDLAAGKIKI